MPQIKNQSFTDLKIGKAIQPSDLPASTGSEIESPKAATPKPAAKAGSKRSAQPGKP